jgi:hypothetical protein
MKKLTAVFILSISTLMMSNSTFANTFTPVLDYSIPAYPATYDVDTSSNAYYSSNFGITVDNAYLQTWLTGTNAMFVGTFAEIGTAQSAHINFIDGTDYVIFGAASVLYGTFSAFNSAGTLLDAINDLGYNTLSLSGNGDVISYMTITGYGGLNGLTSLTYSYDGITDGHNTGIPSVPVPAAVWLFGSGLMGLFGVAKRKKA